MTPGRGPSNKPVAVARIARTAIGALTGALFAAPALAGGGLMVTGDLTSQPIGHYEFCKDNPDECSIRPREKRPVAMSAHVEDMLDTVNAEFNATIEPVSDLEVYGKDEVWSYANKGVGDCEDYVLEKRRELKRQGISLANLLITVVRKRDGEGHAVLTVRTDQGDYILDNLTDDVKLWSQTGYRYLKRQASTHTGRWVSLREENNLLVGSVDK